MANAFWSGKRVLITGHTGFKGSWLTLWLQQLGAVVCGFSLDPRTQPSLFELADVANGIEHHIGDIRDLSSLNAVFRSFRPEVVFHLAAQPIVRKSYELPLETYDVNVMGTAKLLDVVRQNPGVVVTIVVTSDKCYENREVLRPYREIDSLGGHDPYSSSKGCAELVAAAYGRSYFAPAMKRGSVASVRAGNVIGGGDWAKDRLMPDIVRGLIAGEDVVIRRPWSVRPWQHVLEPLSGYLKVAEHVWTKGPMPWDAWNFGPDADSNQTVETFVQNTCGRWGRPDAAKVQKLTGNEPHEAGLLMLDSTKARVQLGWRPRWSFDECIAQTVDWYQAYKNGTDVRATTLNQIAAYEQAQEPAAR